MTLKTLPTIGEIVRRTGSTYHQVEYLIRSRQIQPAGRCGNAYFYSEATVEQISDELRKIAESRKAAAND